jgi:hypothetical protein
VWLMLDYEWWIRLVVWYDVVGLCVAAVVLPVIALRVLYDVWKERHK